MVQMINHARQLLMYLTFKEVCFALLTYGYETTREEVYCACVAAKIMNEG